MTQEKFKKLKMLGQPSNEWHDYLQYGFDSKDIEVLLAIVKQNNVLALKEDDDEIWAPIHAWRVLGQLGDDEIVEPLIDLLNQFAQSDDDWSIQDFPKVFAMIGSSAITSLKQFLYLRTNEEYARVIVNDALAAIYIKDKSVRAEIIDAYNHYLQSPDERAYDLNGLIIANIMDMKITELFEPIAGLFAGNMVDDSICGNLSDVSRALGIKQTKSISRPKAQSINKFSFEKSYQIINKYFKKYATKYSLQEISHLDGYLAAIICSDKMIPPYVWSFEIWGSEKHQPNWENFEEYEEFNNCMVEYNNKLSIELYQDNYQPLIVEDENGKTYPGVWCVGFIDASKYWQADTEDFSIPATLGFGMISILADKNPEDIIQRLNLDIQTIEDNLAENVASIYHELQDELKDDNFDNYNDHLFNDFDALESKPSYQKEQTYIREGKKVGRNEACPCGSGKKHKKCCINK